MYKMAVLDIDGTLITSKRKLTDRTIRTIERLKEKKIPVCLCTGRNLHGTLPVAKKLNLGTPFVCIDGALMYDMYSGNCLYQKLLETEVIDKLLDVAKNNHVFVEIVTEDCYYKYVKNKDLKKYDLGGSFFNVSKMIAYHFGIRYVKNLEPFYKGQQRVYEVVVAGAPEALEKVKADVLAIGCDKLSLRAGLWENYMFMGAAGIQKSEGVLALCRHFGIEMEEVVAIGDEMNDLDMLKAVGMGVAMGNAKEEVKKAAKYITLNNNQDGAAAALAKFFEVQL